MFDLKDIPLAKYSVSEDKVNCITHALGIPFCIIALVLLLRIQIGVASGLRIFSAILYCVSMLMVFAGSAVYHGLKPSRAKQIARIIDHSTIFFMISGVVTSFVITNINASNMKREIMVLCVVWGLSLTGILLGLINFKKFAIVQIFMYVIIGWTIAFDMRIMFLSGGAGRDFVIKVLIGGLCITTGTVLYLVGKKIRYFHSVFHAAVLVGLIVIFIGVYDFNASIF